MHLRTKSIWTGAAALAASVLTAVSPASACGGFFCNQAQPVNQAAERIIFVNNGDGTQTAVIEIMYDGPSESFSWLLPISSVPQGDDIQVASSLGFQRLQAATNPQYTLTTRVEGTCKQVPVPAGTGGSGGTGSGGTGGSTSVGNDGGGVMVEASGVVGAFEWTVISVEDSVDDPATAAVDWLNENDYDVPAGAPALIGPYLADGLYLLALKLTKGSDAGSIRPIVLTYDADLPMIPVKLTAVAANDDMGVMAWVVGENRAVPMNYLALELNEARINWFNAALNYDSVVSEAADDANGQGFVTEQSGPTEALANVIWTSFDQQSWSTVSTTTYSSLREMFETTYYAYGSLDGYWDSVRAVVTLPDGVEFADFKLCPSCYTGMLEFSPSELLAALEAGVIEPLRGMQELIDTQPVITRLYTTMSAEEMSADPIFTFNPDLAELSNLHTAERVIECNEQITQSEAPWRIELPQGGVIRGDATTLGTWPVALDALPPNLVITQLGESGQGKEREDNSEEINELLADYNDAFPAAGGTGGTGGSTGGAGASGSGGGGKGGSTSGAGGASGASGSSSGGASAGGTTGGSAGSSGVKDNDGCACRTAPVQSSNASLLGALGLAALAFGRRRGR